MKSLRRLAATIALLVGGLLAIGVLMDLAWPAVFGIPAGADACLDAGGSYDYAQCRCDYDAAHRYDEKHDC